MLFEGIFDMERRMAGALETERSGVYYIAGPVNGNPYAQIDHSLKAKLRSKPDQGKPYDLAKGIEDLDSLLGDLGYNSAPSSPGFSQNAHVLISSPDKRELKATVLLNKEINNNQPDLRPRKDSFDVQGGLTSNTPLSSPPALDLSTEVSGSKTVPNVDYSRQLAVVTNQSGAGLRMETKPVVEGHIAVSLDTPMHSAAPLLNRERSSASDDVFDSEAKAPSSPTISDLWFDVSKSSLAKGASKKNMSLTRYDNVSYSDTESRSSQSLSRQDSADGMEIQPGIVASHVKSLNRLLFGDDLGDHESQYKKKYGVPLAGLNSPEIVEKKVTQFNLRSAVPGQLAPQTTQIYTRGAFHAVDYDHHEEPRKSSELESVHLRHVVANGYPPAAEDDDSELPHRADTLIRARQPSLTRHEIHTRSPPVLRLVDGRLDAKPHIVDMNRAMVDVKPALVAKKSDLVGTTLIMADEGDLPKIDAHHEADSAYGDSMRSSASYPSSATTPNTTPVTSQLPDAALAVSRKFDGMTVSDAKDEPHRRAIAIEASRQSSADRAPFIPPSGILAGASSTSSWSSIDDEGGGYAKIEDLQLDCSTQRVLTERVGSPTSAGGSKVPSSRPPASALKVVEEDLQSEVIQKHDEFLNDDVFRYLDQSDVRTEAIHKPTKVPPVSPSSETQGLRANVANGTSGLGVRAGLVYGDLNYAIPPSSASQKKAGSPASLDSTVLGVSTVASRWLDQPLLVSTSTAESTSSCLGESSAGSVSDGSSSPRSPSTVRRTLRRRMRGSNSNSSVSSAELFHEVERYPQIKFDKETIHYWYKPMLTREQATALLRERDCGAFVVRDSQSYEGAFGLAVKVETPPLGVLQQAGGDLTKIDLDNELVRHFLIEPCKKGVRLKGSNNEPPFPSLVALVYQHTLTRMALPVALVIPEEDLEESRNGLKSTLTESQLLHKGAACNLVYLGGMDVESLTGDGAVQYAMNKLVSGNHPQKWTLVSIKVNQEGITLTDNQRRLFFRRHYMMKLVLHCGVDPKGRTFNLKVVVEGSDREASCFGFVVAKHALSLDNECHLFAELDVDQPSSAVINFIHKAMRYAKV